MAPPSARSAVSIALWAVLTASAAPAPARSRSVTSLNNLADEFMWDRESRLVRPSLGERGNANWLARLRRYRGRLQRIKTSRLDQQGRITHQMLSAAIGRELRYVTEGWINEDLNAVDSLALTVLDAVDGAAKNNVNDWKWIIKTLRGSGRFMRQYIKLLERGLEAGRAQPAAVVRSSIATVSSAGSRRVRDNPLLKLPRQLERSLAGRPQLPALRAALHEALHGEALPAHRQLARFLRDAYLPRAPRRLGTDLRRYQHHVERHVGAGYTPEQLIRLGRRAIVRAKREMFEVARQIDPKARSLAQFMRKLGQDPSNAFRSAGELLEAAERELDRSRQLAAVHVGIPADKVEVAPVPRHLQRVVDGQYAPVDGTSGRLEINTSNIGSRYRRSAIADFVTHEVYGGHHLQWLHAAGQTRLPAFRRWASNLAFDEGWAMYAEQLRDEQRGFTPEERLEYLRIKLLIASHLVVDASLHSGKMTRRQAEDFMRREVFIPRAEVRGNVERTINWPAQRLSYFVGKEQLLQTRSAAKKILGRHFDARRYHAKLLSLGSVPPPVAHAAMVSWAHRRAGQLSRRRAGQPSRRRAGQPSRR